VVITHKFRKLRKTGGGGCVVGGSTAHDTPPNISLSEMWVITRKLPLDTNALRVYDD